MLLYVKKVSNYADLPISGSYTFCDARNILEVLLNPEELLFQ